MAEYDRGEALSLINYVRRDAAQVKGHVAHTAYASLGELHGPVGTRLPFLTARYDPRNWAMQLFPHNGPACDLLGTGGWLPVTEQHFARLLYRLRGRVLPDLEGYGVSFSTGLWLGYEGGMLPVSWPGQDMSVRRRAYEPEGFRVPYNWRNPCTDIDLVVTGASGEVALLVDYKLTGTAVDTKHQTHKAMSSITGRGGSVVPSMVVKYDPKDAGWTFSVFCLNDAARGLMARALLRTGLGGSDSLPGRWTGLDKSCWFDVLDAAKAA